MSELIISACFCVIDEIEVTISSPDPCNPTPCGPNAICSRGQCSCVAEYNGNPYVGCRPECVLHTDCPRDRACIRNKCTDPCLNTCGVNAICEVINHIPNCRCPEHQEGNAFIQCLPSPCKPLKQLYFSLIGSIMR